MGHVLQGGREGLDQAVGQLGEEADGVHVEDRQRGGQPPRVGCDVERREQLVPGLYGSVPGQGLDQRGLPCKSSTRGHASQAVSGPLASTSEYGLLDGRIGVGRVSASRVLCRALVPGTGH